MGCLVEKSGSSSWHKVFWTLREPHQEFVPNKAYDSNYLAMKNIDASVRTEAHNDPTWIRFLTARHPLARLYSGWNRNLRRGGPMADRLYKSMKLRAWVKERNTQHVISWKDFVTFLSHAAKTNPKLIDGHFAPIYIRCGLCMRQYDCIIKAETSQDDAGVILNQLNQNITNLGD
jgi:hypothetical protein